MKLQTLILKGRLPLQTAVADRFFLRLRGLLGRDFQKFDALLLVPCASVHTCFMSRPIDAVFLSTDMRVIRTQADIPPWKLRARCAGAAAVLELPAGSAAKWGLETGDRLESPEEGRMAS